MKTFLTNILLSLFLILSCAPKHDKILKNLEGVLLKVNYYTVRCQGFIEMDCLLVQEGDAIETEEWSRFYETIIGFDFEPNFVYKLDVKKEERDPRVQDVGRYKYTLIRILSKTAVR